MNRTRNLQRKLDEVREELHQARVDLSNKDGFITKKTSIFLAIVAYGLGALTIWIL